jgi:hypothetical protein
VSVASVILLLEFISGEDFWIILLVCVLTFLLASLQAGRTFRIRYKEHTKAIRNNNGNLGYSNHILNTGHAYGSITNTMKVIETEKKGKHVNTLEKYHIVYKISKARLHMNDTYIDIYDPIFKVIQELNTR